MKNSTLSLYSWNVNGIRAVIRKGAFDAFLKQYDPDILCLQETKANHDQVDIDFPQYEELWNSAERKGYSGTAIFTKQKPINVIHGFVPAVMKKFNFTDDQGRAGDSEGRVITAEFEKNFVTNVYTPNAKPDLSRLNFRYKTWDPAFLLHVKTLEKKKPVIFCGDLNVAHEEIDLARPEENVGDHGFTDEEREGFSNFLKAGFIDTFRHAYPKKEGSYSWWSNWGNARERNVGWRIDYILVSDVLKKRIKKTDIHPMVFGSDHCPISIKFSM